MNKYELLYIIDSSVNDEARAALIEKFAKFVVDNGGVASEPQSLGMKKFQYPINYKNEGFYVLMAFESDSTVPGKLTGIMRITDGIVRTMIEKK